MLFKPIILPILFLSCWGYSQKIIISYFGLTGKPLPKLIITTDSLCMDAVKNHRVICEAAGFVPIEVFHDLFTGEEVDYENFPFNVLLVETIQSNGEVKLFGILRDNPILKTKLKEIEKILTKLKLDKLVSSLYWYKAELLGK